MAISRPGAQPMGFFTDTTTCIGCKACEVACKQWNDLPSDPDTYGRGGSYDYTGSLSAATWRHVRFIEPVARDIDLVAVAEEYQQPHNDFGDWVFMSDVCKHCTHAGCLDACPTGALFRTEFGTVVVQQDICNGCGYCVPSCPFGVIDQRKDDGRVFKCTMCYDRLTDGKMPACATACPTQSIQFGDLDELQARADARLATLKEQGVETARLYLRDENDGVGGAGAFFLLLDEPEVYGLPPDPVVPARDMPSMWRSAAAGAAMVLGIAVSAVLGSRRR
jgi:formate dehydrogenase iron-sulfur subunit